MEKKYTVLCLFSGSGGKSLGFKWAGFRSVGNLIGFEFCGPSSCAEPLADGTPQTGRRKRIGNAVPPPAAYAIARECWDTLAASEADGFRLAGGDIWVEPEERAAC